MAEQPKLKLVFVVGVWRSGTSLLHAMLNLNPHFALMYEAEAFGVWPLRGDFHWPEDWPDRLNFFNQAILRHRLDASALPRQAVGRDCVLAMFRQYADRKPGAKIIGGKSPTYHKWLPEIAAIFPEAEFVILWRDPLDCCRSAAQAAKKNHFFSQPGMQTQVIFGAEKMARGVEWLKAAGRRVHELTYPDLTTEPERELRRICEFLGVPIDARMLDLVKADLSMVPAGDHHARVRSGTVNRTAHGPENLPEEFVAKGRRYAAVWRQRFAHLKFSKVLPVADNQTVPAEAERLGDWLAVQFWNGVNTLKRVTFRTIPLPFWVRLRETSMERSRLILDQFISSTDGANPAPSPAAKRHLTFSIITPSYKNSAWLKLCIASVADQQGVELEHIVQDSCSDDGTQDWLPHDRRVKAFIEKDQGMYDAVNRGYRRATGDILAYLNCDEQYLPGALAAVRDFFEQNPHIEVALAGSIITDGDGNYICHRHLMELKPRHVWYRFPFLTSSVFIRRKVIHERGIFFDTRWRDLGDFHWAMSLLKFRVPMAECPVFTSVFADTGENMNLKPNAIREKRETAAMIPRWLRPLKPLWIFEHRLRRLWRGHFNLKPTSYAIYTKASPDHRVTIDVPNPTAIWWNRL